MFFDGEEIARKWPVRLNTCLGVSVHHVEGMIHIRCLLQSKSAKGFAKELEISLSAFRLRHKLSSFTKAIQIKVHKRSQ